RRHAGVVDDAAVATVVTVGVSLVGIFVFLATSYRVLTNASLTWREALPGAVVAAVVLEARFQLLPAVVAVSSHDPRLRALSWQAVLLVWLYVMANVTVLGAEVNWHVGRAPVDADTAV